MDQTFIEERKQQLLEVKAELEKDLSAVAEPDAGDHVIGDFAAKYPNYGEDNYLDSGSDTPDEIQEFQVNLSVTEKIEGHLKQVKEALKRIEDGTYGKDLKTGEAISEDRLRVNPSATTAITKQ